MSESIKILAYWNKQFVAHHVRLFHFLPLYPQIIILSLIDRLLLKLAYMNAVFSFSRYNFNRCSCNFVHHNCRLMKTFIFLFNEVLMEILSFFDYQCFFISIMLLIKSFPTFYQKFLMNFSVFFDNIKNQSRCCEYMIFFIIVIEDFVKLLLDLCIFQRKFSKF